MTKNKKKVLIGSSAVAVIALSLTVGITLSYLGKTTNKKNTINVGYGDVEISEEFNGPSEMSMINPDIRKEIYVQNKSTVPAFARVYAEFSDSKIADQAKEKYKPEEGSTTWENFKKELAKTGNERTIQSDWVYVASDTNDKLNGYFYYTKALGVPTTENDTTIYQATTKLFDSVTIDYKKYGAQSSVIDGSNTDRIVPVEMIVYSELVQTIETGSTIVTDNGQTSTVYGYDYGKNHEWKEAWEHFLK